MIKRKESKYTTTKKKNHQITENKARGENRTKEVRNNQKTIKKMVIVNPYL